MREYMPGELNEAVRSAGFEVASLFTKVAPARNNATSIQRGEQMFLLARKKSGAPIQRYPRFLYDVA